MVTHLASGYHQLKISKEDAQLFGFLLEDGVYRYAKKPMSFINSGHRFVNIVNRLLVELELTMEVDDVLIKGDDEDEVIERFKKFLHRCQKINIKLARRKLQYGLVVNFAWMQLRGERGHKPAPSKLEAIATLKAPENISDL